MTEDADEAVETFYSEERWQNWISRIEEEELDPENEDSARLLINLQDDAAIAVAKVLSAYEDGRIDEDRALEEIEDVREIVLTEVDFDDEDKTMLIDGVQTSLVPVFYAAEEYIVGGVVEGDLGEYVTAAADAEADEDLDAALGYVVQAGTRVIDGDELDIDLVESIEYGLVSEWVNGLDSLQSAIQDPEVVEED
ncbi:DUF2150 family protein [Halopenitus sp. POP-27]|uniref:DUF2150 family protein n=1 Tax=Halopenitus sp. POP-27 TaxID=2994425 RepID=UPI00246950CA|nr:DUF2150 family protein [Halopenitus sp. POP-27]